MSIKAKGKSAVFILLSMFFIAPCSFAENVTVGLPFPQSVYNGSIYSAAEEMGLFEEENLEVDTIILKGSGSLIPQLTRNRITIGFPAPGPIITGYFENDKKPLPIKYFYNATPRQTLQYAVLESADIKKIEDLKNKQIGVGSLTWGTIPMSQAALRLSGLEAGKDVFFTPVGSLGSGFKALEDGRVDALNFNISWNRMLEQSGTPIHTIDYPEVLQPMPVNGFAAHTDTLEGNPDLFERFGRAYTKALYVCKANPSYCVEAYWRQNPAAAPRGDRALKKKDAQDLLLQRVGITLGDGSAGSGIDDTKIGHFDMDKITQAVTELAEQNRFESADIPLNEMFTNELVSDFNNFDKQELMKRAESQ